MTLSFEGLGLESRLVSTLTERGYETPTPIQAALIPVLLEGRDAIGQAPTGTGKTAAFSLPTIQRLQSGVGHVQMLVLAPTRELAIQVADTMYAYGKAAGTRVLPIYGGQPYGRQISRLRSGVDVVVGTPGRLLDLCEKGALDLSQVSTVILDEADEMLSMGFVEDIETLLDQTPKERQTILLSATMPSRIRRLAKKYLREAEFCSVEADEGAPVIRQRAYLVNRRDKVVALVRLFEAEEMSSVLIFAKTRLGTEDLAAALVERGVLAEALHGNMGQDARSRIVRKFRDGKIRVLVGTDVAARGLDIDNITHVVNFELPADPEVYIHRIGRTGRAGREGEAITLFAHNETGKLRRVERFAGVKMERPQLPTVEEIEALRSAKVIEKVSVWIERGRCNAERELVQKMIEEGGDPLEIAAAALRVARAAEYSGPVESVSETGPRRGGSRGTDGRGNRDGYGRSEPRFRSDGDRRPGSDYGRGKRREGSNGRDRSRDGRTGNTGREVVQSHRQDGPRSPRPQTQGFERRGGMVKLALSAGKSSGIQVNNVVSTIARHGGIPADAIGRIWIDDKRTLVDVHESEVPRLLGKSGELRFGSARLNVDLI